MRTTSTPSSSTWSEYSATRGRSPAGSPRAGIIIAMQTPEREIDRVRTSFDRQGLMRTLGAALKSVGPGEVRIEMAVRPELSQQHGFVHAGAVIAIIDSACGYAALSLADAANEVLTVELKVNLLAPARGDTVRAVGRVLRRGRTLTVCQGDAFAIEGGSETHIATVLTTMMVTAAPKGGAAGPGPA